MIDIQNDFCPGGSLAVPEGDAVVPVANALQKEFDIVLATQDWHPPEHVSFASNHHGRSPGDQIDVGGIPQTLWPDHCVQGSRGAEFHPALDVLDVQAVFRKGVDPQIDSYSGFFDNSRLRSTGLGDYLDERGIDELWIVGLATDYCVRATALDAAELRLATYVVKEGVRGVDLAAGDSERALDDMREAGVHVVSVEAM